VAQYPLEACGIDDRRMGVGVREHPGFLRLVDLALNVVEEIAFLVDRHHGLAGPAAALSPGVLGIF
jgi:hypothetical protein